MHARNGLKNPGYIRIRRKPGYIHVHWWQHRKTRPYPQARDRTRLYPCTSQTRLNPRGYCKTRPYPRAYNRNPAISVISERSWLYASHLVAAPQNPAISVIFSTNPAISTIFKAKPGYIRNLLRSRLNPRDLVAALPNPAISAFFEANPAKSVFFMVKPG